MTYHDSVPPSVQHSHATPHDPASPRRRRRLGLPLLAIIGLALLGAPRVILHDLGIIHEGTAVNALFVAVPPVIWIVVALVAKVPNPFVTLLVVGVLYGVLLVLTHQLLWTTAFPDGPPRLGGNVADLDPAVQDLIVRAFSVPTGLITGTVVGAIAGLVAWPISALTRRAARR